MLLKRFAIGFTLIALGAMLFNCPAPGTGGTESGEARLSAMAVSAGILTPAFSEDTTSYTLAVENAVGSVLLTPTVKHNAATVAFRNNAVNLADGNIPLTVGINQVEIVVTAENGASTMTYSISVTRDDGCSLLSFLFESDENAGLGSDCIGVINSDNTVTVTVPFGTNVGALVASFNVSSGASVAVNGNPQTSGATQNNFTSSVSYTITATDLSTKQYLVTVEIAPNNAKNFTVFRFEAAHNPGLPSDCEGVIGTDTISVTIPYGVGRDNLIATFSTSGTGVHVGIDAQTSGLTANNFISGVTYTVTAADASTKNYIVTVSNAIPSNNADLSALALSVGSLSPAFDAATTTYAVSILNPANSAATITPTAAESHATFVIRKNGIVTGNPVAIDLGLTTVTIVVTAQDGVTERTYSIQISRGTTMADLTGLTISVGTLTPVFSASTLTYSVFEATEISALTISPTPSDEYASCVIRKNGTAASNPVPLSAGNTALTVQVTSSDQSTTKTYTVNVVVPKLLTLKTWQAGSLTAGEEKWFYFVNANARTAKYAFNWNDSSQGSGMTGNITGSAYHPDRTTAYFSNINNGYTTCQKISVPAGETVYFLAKGYVPSSAGTFAVRYMSTEWNAAVDPVFEMDFGSNTSLDLDILNPGGKKLYMVKANPSTSSAESTATGYTAQVNSPADFRPTKDITDRGPAAGGIIREEPAKVRKFAGNLPAKSRTLKNEQNMTPEYLVNYGDNTGAGFAVGTTTKILWTLGAGEANVQVTATLRAIGDYCYIWVPDSYYDNASGSSTDNKITQTQINALAANFDNIFGWETNIFGFEFGGGPGGTGGRDEDQHISILVNDIFGDYASGQTGGVLGYFAPYDYYSQAYLDINYPAEDLKTNYMEIFYIDTHFTDFNASYIYSTLMHEYQHMIHFNRKYLTYGLSTPTWYNEMCSMVAEDLLRTKLGISTGDSPQGRFALFNYAYDLSGITDWLSSPNTIISYSTAYAFGAFLARNYGGAGLFNSLIANSQSGTVSIASAVAAQGYSLTFADLFKQYSTALVFETEASASVKVFNKAYSGTLNGITYDLNAVNIYSYHQLNDPTEPFGPYTYVPSLQVVLRPYGHSVHTKTGWNAVATDTTFSVTAPTDTDVKIIFMLK